MECDHEMLGHRMVIYDALYAWCQSCQAETHHWPPQLGPRAQAATPQPKPGPARHARPRSAST